MAKLTNDQSGVKANDLYDGPVILVAADGDETPMHARLGWDRDGTVVSNESFVQEVPGPRVWNGVLEFDGPLTGRQLSVPGTIRFPDGSEGVFVEMSGDSGSPHRVEVTGDGEPPWDRS